jgi:ribosomal protein L24
MKIKKGDTVQVISGPDRGAKGKVIAAYPKQQRVLVGGRQPGQEAHPDHDDPRGVRRPAASSPRRPPST